MTADCQGLVKIVLVEILDILELCLPTNLMDPPQYGTEMLKVVCVALKVRSMGVRIPFENILWESRDSIRLLLIASHGLLQALGKKERSLSALLKEYAGVVQDKKYQISDWLCRQIHTRFSLNFTRLDSHLKRRWKQYFLSKYVVPSPLDIQFALTWSNSRGSTVFYCACCGFCFVCQKSLKNSRMQARRIRRGDQ